MSNRTSSMYDRLFQFFSNAFKLLNTATHNAKQTDNLLAKRSIPKIKGTYWKASIDRQVATPRNTAKGYLLSKSLPTIPRCLEKYRSPSAA